MSAEEALERGASVLALPFATRGLGGGRRDRDARVDSQLAPHVGLAHALHHV